MQRSSNSIASLAMALAKAQVELVNPEKSLVGTIHADGAGREERSFNYASLASGLDIVRKTLGQHEIATVQTTAIDQSAGVVNLTTVLAHSSGEWIASDWPVCAVSDTATPRRMGAALTYARRYALFTLVGIAGEDDLDAPDLQTPTSQANQKTPANQSSASQKRKGAGNGHPNGGGTRSRPHAKDGSAPATPTLSADASAALRERLLTELDKLGSGDDAASWAHRCLPEKTKLTTADAQCIEEAFVARLAVVVVQAVEGPSEQQPPRPHGGAARRRLRAKGVDKSLLAFPEPRRIRDRDHIRYVAQKPCLVCGRTPCDAHHLRFTQSSALGRKVSDEFTVPLCRGHHREVHRCGDEAAWWSALKINPINTARKLWLDTHPLRFGQEGKADEDAMPPARSDSDRTDRKRDRALGKGRANDETKPIVGAR
jgi:ERF superfamily protein